MTCKVRIGCIMYIDVSRECASDLHLQHVSKWDLGALLAGERYEEMIYGGEYRHNRCIYDIGI